MLEERGLVARRMVVLLCVIALTGPAASQTNAAAGPVVIDQLAACQTVRDPGERLACFDRTAARLSSMIAAQDIVVFDQEEIKTTRRGLFGFSLRGLPFFGRDESAGAKEEAFSQLTAKVASARDDGYGKYTIKLDNGAVWRTTEPVVLVPKPGREVTIRKAALGSYFLRIGNVRGVRAMRVS